MRKNLMCRHAQATEYIGVSVAPYSSPQLSRISAGAVGGAQIGILMQASI